METELTPTPTRKPVRKGYLIIAVLVAIGLLYLALKDISWSEVWNGIRQARLEYYLLTILLGGTTIYIRGLRWGVLLSAQKKINHLTMLWATSIGYLGNLLLPARAGEVIRSVMLGSRENISKSYVFATAITERILDVIILVLIGVFSIPSIGGLPDGMNQALRVMGILGVAALFFLVLAPRFSHLIQRFMRWLQLPEKVKHPLENFIDEFLLGAQAFQNPARAAGFLGYSAIIWFLDATGTIFMSHALHLDFSYAQGLVLLLAIGLSSAIPSTPGYLGIYQYVGVTLLPLYGITRSLALTYILLFQMAGAINILILGFTGLRQLNIRSLKEIS